MNVLIALAVGYVVGAKSGSRELEQLGRSLRALCETDEFADVVVAARAQVARLLREAAGVLDGAPPEPEPSGDLVTRVRRLVGHD